MEFSKIVEFAQAAWPVASYIAAIGYTYGWISPALSKKQNDRVVEKYNNLIGNNYLEEVHGRKPSKINNLKIAVLNITRLAFIHSAIHSNSYNKEKEKYKSK